MVFHPVAGKQRVTRCQRADIQLSGDILPAENSLNTRHRITRGRVDVYNFRMSVLAENRAQMQHARQGEFIVDIFRFAADVFIRTFMFQAFARAAVHFTGKLFY
ncbi:hypothetical protein D3C75_858100 [compost metagenome]